MPNTNLRVTLQDLTDVVRELPTEEALCLEIDNLCTAALTIDEAFCDIGRKLTDATKEQNKRVDLSDTCHTLETRWNEHRLVGSYTYKMYKGLSRDLDVSKLALAF